MTRSLSTLVAGAALSCALIVAPAAADAAKVKVSGGTIAVDDNGVAPIKVKNPNSTRAKGQLKLKSGTVAIGSRRFNIRPHRSAKVNVQLSRPALEVLAQGDALRAVATAAVKGKGTARANLILYYPGAQSGDGGGSSGGDSTGGGDGGNGSGSGDGGGQAGAAWRDGRWQGRYAFEGVNLAFNVVGTRLYAGPFDSFYIKAQCEGSDTESSTVGSVEATIGSDGNFSGSGTYYSSPDHPIPWTISGHISGTSITNGTFSVSYTSFSGHPCTGTTNFTAAWYGDYTGKVVALR